MIIAQIKKIKNPIPIEPGSAEDLHIEGEPQSYMLLSSPDSVDDFPFKEEKGRITLDIEFAEGATMGKNFTTLIFDGSPLPAKVVEVAQTSPTTATVVLFVNTIFKNGFRFAVSYFISKGSMIAFFSPEDQMNLNTYDAQKKLFDSLVDLIFGAKGDKIKALAQPCYVLSMAESGTKGLSHFLGAPKTEIDSQVPYGPNQTPQFHLATIYTDHISNFLAAHYGLSLRKNLSFYLRIEDTENGWPEKPDEFTVLHYNEEIEHPASALSDETECYMAFIERLDLPSIDHALIERLNLNDSQEERYETLFKTFRSIVKNDESFSGDSKLFGYPTNVQGCVACEAEHIRSKADYSPQVVAQATEWQLLLQVSPYAQRLKFFDKFGDGDIYFMIKKQDLKAGNFENVQIVVQST